MMKQKRAINKRYISRLLVSELRILLVLMAGFMTLHIQAQHNITGTIRDSHTQLPLSAVQVQAMSSKTAATTDSLGHFSISVEKLTDVLILDAFDYDIIQVPIKGRQEIDIRLYSDKLTPVYTSVNDVKSKKLESHTAASLAQLDDMGKPLSLTFEQQMQTKLGGDLRSVTRSGLNGIGNVSFLRGYNSIHANAQPLIVVDGVIWDRYDEITSLHAGYSTNPLSDISLSDIQSVTIVKDAVSIYGTKGANGVIILETKRGVDMVTKIEVNATIGMLEEATSLPMMDADDYRIYTTDLLGGMQESEVEDLFGYTSDMLPFLNDDESVRTYAAYHNNTDWDDEVYRKGFYSKYDISINGGDEKALYYFSVGYAGTEEYVGEVNMQQLYTRFNSDISLYDNFDLGLSIGFNNTTRDLMDDGVSFYNSPTYLAMIKSPFVSPYAYSLLGEVTSAVDDADIFGVSNPSAILQNSLNTNRHYRFNVGISPKVKINKHWTISDRFDYNLTNEQESFYSPKIGVADRTIEGYGIAENTYRSQNSYNVGLYNDAFVQFDKQFAAKHNLKAVFGNRYMQNQLELDYAEGHNTGTDETRKLLDDLDFKKLDGIYAQTKSISNYINVDYNFDYRYFITIAAAMDAASSFGNETQGGVQMFGRSWGIFPSLQAAWLASSETFMSDANFVNQLKLRASAGLSGNDDIDPYAMSAYFSSVRYMGDANGIVLANYANDEIQWETSLKSNIGIDARLFDNRFDISVDGYKSFVSNLLHYQNLPMVLGTGVYQVNGGDMTNTGFDLNVNVRALDLKKLKWEVGASIGHYDNKVTSLPNGEYTTQVFGATMLTTEGESAGVFYGYKTDGVFTDAGLANDAALYLLHETGTVNYFGAGDVKFDDHNGDSEINEDDMQIIGDPNPDLYGAFNTRLVFGDLSLNAMFTFSYGNDAYNYQRALLESGNSFNNQTTAMLDRWAYEGQSTATPKVVYGDPMGNARFSDRWIEDASYLKFKTLSLNYKVPLSTKMIDGLEVWVAANNLFTWTNYLGRDPEFSVNNQVLYQGVDVGLMPQTTSYFVGVKVNL